MFQTEPSKDNVGGKDDRSTGARNQVVISLNHQEWKV